MTVLWDPPRRPRHRQCRFRLGHSGQARQRGNHPARTIRQRQPRLGTNHPEAKPERRGPDAQIAKHPANGASHPFLPSSAGRGLPQGDPTLGEVRSARRALIKGELRIEIHSVRSLSRPREKPSFCRSLFSPSTEHPARDAWRQPSRWNIQMYYTLVRRILRRGVK
jgi:hypothetical protein